MYMPVLWDNFRGKQVNRIMNFPKLCYWIAAYRFSPALRYLHRFQNKHKFLFWSIRIAIIGFSFLVSFFASLHVTSHLFLIFVFYLLVRSPMLLWRNDVLGRQVKNMFESQNVNSIQFFYAKYGLMRNIESLAICTSKKLYVLFFAKEMRF